MLFSFLLFEGDEFFERGFCNYGNRYVLSFGGALPRVEASSKGFSETGG